MLRERTAMLTGVLMLIIALVLPSQAEDPYGNGVLVGGNTWGAYRPPHINNGQFLYPGALNNNFVTRGDGALTYGNYIFYQGRHISSPLFGNPGFSWPSGKFIGDAFNGVMGATVFDPSPEFRAANEKNFELAPADEREYHYSMLKYSERIPGAGDPARDFINPGGKGLDGGGMIWKDDTKGMQYYEAGWPTNVGIDVKFKVTAFTTPWGNLDDFHLIEVEFHNTGEADIDGDGTVDLTNNTIKSLAMNHGPTGNQWRMTMNASGGRRYATGTYRGVIHDATPDENSSPWNYSAHVTGARDTNTQTLPGVGNTQAGNWYYMDVIHGWTWLGAKKVDENGLIAGDKNLAFKNSAGEEVVPAVGEGDRRGWFSLQTTTDARMNNNAMGYHLASIGQFFVDGGKTRSNSPDALDFSPNPNLFQSGTPGDETSFVVKDDPSSWSMPDGAFEFVPPVSSWRGINLSAPNPISSTGLSEPTEVGLLREGYTVFTDFDKTQQSSMGPFALEPGETIRCYFVQGWGFRLTGFRQALKAARTAYSSIQNGTTGEVADPGAPAVPEIAIAGSPNVKPMVMFNTVDGADGYKIYRSRAWPKYNPWEDGLPYETSYWKTMTPGAENRPAPIPINPMLDTSNPSLIDVDGEYWGPYVLLKTISNAELEQYRNPRTADAGSFPYAYEDNEDAFTLPGQTFWYYVASYKNSRPGAPYDQLEDGGVNWIESGKVNFNGRSGEWTGTWPNTPNHAYYPGSDDPAGQRAVGVPFVNISRPVEAASLALDRVNIVVRPNPYKRVAFHDVGTEHKILFANLPAKATITILDVSGQIIDRIEYSAPTAEDGTYFWNMFSKDGTEVANGMYIWVVEHDRGVEKGMLAILRN